MNPSKKRRILVSFVIQPARPNHRSVLDLNKPNQAWFYSEHVDCDTSGETGVRVWNLTSPGELQELEEHLLKAFCLTHNAQSDGLCAKYWSHSIVQEFTADNPAIK